MELVILGTILHSKGLGELIILNRTKGVFPSIRRQNFLHATIHISPSFLNSTATQDRILQKIIRPNQIKSIDSMSTDYTYRESALQRVSYKLNLTQNGFASLTRSKSSENPNSISLKRTRVRLRHAYISYENIQVIPRISI